MPRKAAINTLGDLHHIMGDGVAYDEKPFSFQEVVAVLCAVNCAWGSGQGN